jgi:D-xylose transport system ATP-binding protein
MTEDTPLLEARGVSKAFGAVQALYDVDFEVRSGEVMALVGDNGAGKSTLIKSIAGIYSLDEGELLFEGEPIEIHSPREAARLGIEIVYQDLALADNLDVVANMFLGRERLQNGFVLNESSMERTSRETLDSLHVTTLRSVRQAVAGLSGGQRQAVAVARAAAFASKIVILDEPTAALGVRESRTVLHLIRRLRDAGMGVIVISHAMDHVIEVADRAAVLRRGRKVGELVPSAETQKEMVSLIVGGDGLTGG